MISANSSLEYLLQAADLIIKCIKTFKSTVHHFLDFCQAFSSFKAMCPRTLSVMGFRHM